MCDIKHNSRGLLKTCQVWEPQIQTLLVNSEEALVRAAKARKGNLVYDFSLNLHTLTMVTQRKQRG